jgi:hypothetical protein
LLKGVKVKMMSRLALHFYNQGLQGKRPCTGVKTGLKVRRVKVMSRLALLQGSGKRPISSRADRLIRQSG